MKPTLLTPAQATDPESGPTMQRPLATRLAYPLGLRLADWCVGLRDRRTVRRRLAELTGPDGVDHPVLTLDTVYQQTLERACAGHLEVEFLQTVVMLKQVDALIAQAQTRARDAEAVRRRTEAATPDPAQVLVDGDEVALARLDRTRQASRDAEAGAAAELARLRLERAAHWAALHRRSAQVLAFFDLRAATYGNAATRAVRTRVAPVRVGRPAWLARVVPPEPGQVTGADGELAPWGETSEG